MNDAVVAMTVWNLLSLLLSAYLIGLCVSQALRRSTRPFPWASLSAGVVFLILGLNSAMFRW